jgi:hypothetical protein
MMSYCDGDDPSEGAADALWGIGVALVWLLSLTGGVAAAVAAVLRPS